MLYKLGREFQRDDFYAEFGKGSTFPQIIGWKETRCDIRNCTVSEGEQISLVVVQMDEEIYDIVEKAVDYSFNHKFPLKNFYTYLKPRKYKRKEVQEFLDSSTVKNIGDCWRIKRVYQGGNKAIRKPMVS